MKTITIRLPDVEAAIFEDLRKRPKSLLSIQKALSEMFRKEYSGLKCPKA